MANLSITTQCNRNCSYCFALEPLADLNAASQFMSLEVFARSLDFLRRSGIGEVRLLGGEPTIHPHFVQMIDTALESGFRLLVFSGGLIPNKVLEKLEQISEERLSVLVNVLPPGEGRPAEQKRQAEVYRRLGRRVVLGLNIPSPSVKLDFLLEWIASYDLVPTVRLGLAHPIHNGTNEYLHPRHYPEVGRRVSEFGLRARERGVHLEFDCGWVPCMFPEGALEMLGKGPDEVGLRCNPILDVLPDGQVISCYPLASHAAEWLPDDHDDQWLRGQFAEKQEADRRFMLYQECNSCAWRMRGECTGGCLSGSLRRLRRAPFSVSVDFSETPKEQLQQGCGPNHAEDSSFIPLDSIPIGDTL